jgi:hypothetical protein
MWLDSEQYAGRIKDYKRQFKMSLDVNGKHVCNYITDFIITMSDGSQQIHEVKGYFTPISKIKWKLAKILYENKYKFVLIK